MKKYLIPLFLLLFTLSGFMPANPASAADGKVTLKSYKYKGQPYVQIVNHPNKNVANKMNKELKQHAVHAAAQASSKEIKADKDYYYRTYVETAYNKNNSLSVIYFTYAYTGGAHDMQWVNTYNFDTKTGKRIYLKDFLNNRTKIVRANLYLQSIFEKRNSADPGAILYPDTVIDTNSGTFFFNDKGFTLRFSPYEVAAFSEGFIDVYIPYDVLNTAPDTTQTPAQNTKPESVTTGILASEISVYSNDLKTFLGTLSTNTFDSNSIFNKYGTYGSEFSSSSIWNEFGTYGSEFSAESAFNPYSSTPPVLVYKGEAFAYVSENEFLTNSISPNNLYNFATSIK